MIKCLKKIKLVLRIIKTISSMTYFPQLSLGKAKKGENNDILFKSYF